VGTSGADLEQLTDAVHETVDTMRDVVCCCSDEPPVDVLEVLPARQVLPEGGWISAVQIALVLDRNPGIGVGEVHTCNPLPVDDDIVVERRFRESAADECQPRPGLSGRPRSPPDLIEREAELHDAANAASSSDGLGEFVERRPAEPPHERVARDDEFVERQHRAQCDERVGRSGQRHSSCDRRADRSVPSSVADRAANPERLVGTDRRDVQPLIAFETAGERDADDRCRSDVTEDLIGAESRSERPCSFIHGLRWER